MLSDDCQARKLNKEDAMGGSKWSMLITVSDVQCGCERVSVSSGTGLPASSRTKGC